MTVTDAINYVHTIWVTEATLRQGTVDKYVQDLDRFGRFVAAHKVHTIGDITEAHVQAFLDAEGRDRHGNPVSPKQGTSASRLTVVRAFFGELRAAHRAIIDPSEWIGRPDRTPAPFRHLTQNEAENAYYKAGGPQQTVRQATCALGLAGVHTGEIGNVTIPDIGDHTVTTHGSARIAARTITIPDDLWVPIASLAAERAATLWPTDPATIPLTTMSTGHERRQSSVVMSIRSVLDRCGLSRSDGVRPESLPAYAGRRIFDTTGRIEDAAKLLGFASLDTTARFIGHDWADAA
jgi:integrase/recombinase XerC